MCLVFSAHGQIQTPKEEKIKHFSCVSSHKVINRGKNTDYNRKKPHLTLKASVVLVSTNSC